MGVGKTTIGRQLAKSLHREFIDSDREIEQRTGVRIALIFEIEGEAGFRERESQMLTDLTRRRDIVLATGGGAVIRAENRRLLSDRGVVVYLRAPLALLVERTARDRQRPLLQNNDPKATLTALLAEREPLYREIADLIVDTGHRTVRHIVNEIRVFLDACQDAHRPR
ncbi:MAG TPA: shikimate kinase AroK [Gammaproteobacteria bacterium]|nr:shikimate kinase AroK [Gammaproteobacteria bacterium]